MAKEGEGTLSNGSVSGTLLGFVVCSRRLVAEDFHLLCEAQMPPRGSRRLSHARVCTGRGLHSPSGGLDGGAPAKMAAVLAALIF